MLFLAAEIDFLEQNCVLASEPSLRTLQRHWLCSRRGRYRFSCFHRKGLQETGFKFRTPFSRETRDLSGLDFWTEISMNSNVNGWFRTKFWFDHTAPTDIFTKWYFQRRKSPWNQWKSQSNNSAKQSAQRAFSSPCRLTILLELRWLRKTVGSGGKTMTSAALG